MAGIEICSSCVVRMEKNSTPNSIFELNQWDLQLLLADPSQRGIFFKTNGYQTLESQTLLVDHLKTTLSRTLDYFPPLAGRLGTTANSDGTISFHINCSNAGAEFTHAVAGNMSISDLLEPKYIPDTINSLFALNGVVNSDGVSKPLLGVQVSFLADGLFIGCTANHAVLDGIALWHFFNSWSEISRGAETISKLPVFERWFPDGIKSLRIPPLQQNESANFVRPSMLRRFFHFSKQAVSELKAKANQEAGMDSISSLQAVSAHLWRGVTRARRREKIKKGCNQEDQREIPCMFAVGARDRIPLPDGYFGNGLIIAQMFCQEAEILENGLGYAARKMKDLVAQHNRDAAIKYAQHWVKNPVVVEYPAITTFAVGGSPRFNVYGCDFGWGKPVAVRSGMAQPLDGKMTVFPAPEPGGIDVEAWLAPETLMAMDDDAEFMEAFAV
ncbi:uncharacterized acetyltransferase At3g50280-like [Andrographis paniculata]|uniref:uncharacterized acetyltransferase At3g50280-like n=1 Tax=Andrographis paniculata TaxID=175694 RepID=UPI0021E9295B|nr:uncharacterized acetyltransferase At3g50280-like [Andrographis paniculata]XP_051136766.1 uncharacterized acetyltransferase At3g50280-like [Andrographis paniculata]